MAFNVSGRRYQSSSPTVVVVDHRCWSFVAIVVVAGRAPASCVVLIHMSLVLFLLGLMDPLRSNLVEFPSSISAPGSVCPIEVIKKTVCPTGLGLPVRPSSSTLGPITCRAL